MTGIPEELRNPTKTSVEVAGIDQDSHLERHDPSNIIRHEGLYYLWYTEHGPEDGFIDTYVKVATSPDGLFWTVRGTALDKGAAGDWDEKGALTAYVVPHAGKYTMFYTGVSGEFETAQKSRRGIGYAVADSPEGPWRKCTKPILWPGDDGAWDELCCDDANILFREGKWWLYYKGRVRNGNAHESQIGLALSDNLTGPYRKHPENPLFMGHALSAWVHRDGVAAIEGEVRTPAERSVLWSEDGVHFAKAGAFDNKSTGFYCPENFGNGVNNRGVDWGFDVIQKTKPRYIFRFDCSMVVDSPGS